MNSVFHEGELAVQRRAGVEGMARRVSAVIDDTISPAARDFYGAQSFVVLGTIDAEKRVWASLLTGEPGFIRVIDERTVFIESSPVARTAPLENFLAAESIGLLVIEPATRRRMRLNGRAQIKEGGLEIRAEQVFGNCPKYIQARTCSFERSAETKDVQLTRGPALSAQQQQWMREADTFFIASAHPERGTDISHRGGAPGFVLVPDESTLLWPDYAGNMMFQTLGNITVNARVGLLFIDFERGTTLQVTGSAALVWDADIVAGFAGAERVVAFQVQEVIERSDGAANLRWRFLDYSPVNPR